MTRSAKGLLRALALFGALGLMGAAPRGPSGLQGEMFLQKGRYRLALPLLRQAVEEQPGALRYHALLARAEAGTGRCTSALRLLAPLRATPVWSGDLAVLEAGCLLTLGDAGGAVAAFDEASALGGPPVGVTRAIAEARWAEAPGVDGWVAWLDQPHPTHALLQVAAARAWWRGDMDRVDDVLDEARFLADRRSADPGLVYWVYLMDGLRWLALGEAGLAEAALARAVRAQPNDRRAPTWRAEALRRLGDLSQAEAVFGRALFLNSEAPPWQAAVQARIAVDIADHGRAGELLGAVTDDAELLASAWYLARAQGRSDQAALADRWARLSGRSADELAYLLPEFSL